MDTTNISNNKKIQMLFRNNKPLIIMSLFLLGGLIVFGQIGFIASIVLMLVIHWFRKSSMEELGLSNPKSWLKVIGLGVLLTIVIMTIVLLLINPLIFELFPPETKDLSRFNNIKGNEGLLILSIIGAWITAGFAEELIWRGYVMKQIAILFGNKRSSWIISLLISSITFGFLHFYQGPIGIIQTGIVGLFFGIIFIVNGKKNLWINIIVHGLIDTISMIALYMGAV
ncbi:CPBP family intramembrane glutamic endopeptidase [Flavivirga spongiicola]|uniref:CPBP family intramembrane metalloprotease n=1 Tax=Flavivirga spongiicola TaxID=421621 RepID=A0ABU7XVR4_9FLAO|nr:type II CAAX endopeptidase family protein [Flavivirga sp. MEBiC05379]MDO5979866.1 type II CAAX endopeptidase family protein [Flavivirga sp. MEBiC05379]